MAHQLTARMNGFIEFAALGERQAVWHRLGQYLPEGQSIEQWQTAAGMDWDISESSVSFNTANGLRSDPTRKVLYRSDTEDVLSVVSDDYHVVQPREVLEFFREFTENNSMKLSAAGTLFGGRRFWATAEMGKSFEVVQGDKVEGFLLLTTSADGTLSTQAKFTSTRVVCNNTLGIALQGGAKVRKTHRSAFDPQEFKVDMGLIDAGWENFIQNTRKLADEKVAEEEAKSFFMRLINPKSEDTTKIGIVRQFDALMHFYKNGAGAEFSHGTKWGLLNAVTEMQTHGTGRGDRSSQFNSSEFGKGADIKAQAFAALTV